MIDCKTNMEDSKRKQKETDVANGSENEDVIDTKRCKVSDPSELVLNIQKCLCDNLIDYDGGQNVAFTYNPLIYASEPHKRFVRKFCKTGKDVLFLGMNPGPFGMAQTGVPFGEVNYVRDWLKINGKVSKPPAEHPKRPINGFDCSRSEVSGARLWKFAQTHFNKPEDFFAKAYIYNYCPLIFMTTTGKNIVPGSIPIVQRKILFQHCDEALLNIIDALEVSTVVGIGKFCYDKAKALCKDRPTITVVNMMHPSPASPAANRDWAGIALKQLKECGVWAKLK